MSDKKQPMSQKKPLKALQKVFRNHNEDWCQSGSKLPPLQSFDGCP